MDTSYESSPFLEAFSDDVDAEHNGWGPDESEPYEAYAPADWGSGSSGPRDAALEAALEAEVLDKKRDSRDRIKSTLGVPHRWICWIEIESQTKKGSRRLSKARGTGILIGPRHLLTAAHALYEIKNGFVTVPKKMRVVPARNGSSKPFGETKAARANGRVVCKVPRGWITRHAGKPYKNDNYDFGLVLLQDELQGRKYKGIELGYWGWPPSSEVKRLDPDRIRRYFVAVTGYPHKVNKPRRKQTFSNFTQWQSLGRITDISSKKWEIEYDADTSKGQSGGAVWLWDGGKVHLVGVHADGGLSNSGPRITGKLLEWVTAWSQEWDKGVAGAKELEAEDEGLPIEGGSPLEETEFEAVELESLGAEEEPESDDELEELTSVDADYEDMSARDFAGEVEVIDSDPPDPESDLEPELEDDHSTGLSRVAAQRTKTWPARRNRPRRWRGRVYGLAVHTTGGGAPKKALEEGITPVEWAIRYYNKKGSTHYVNGWTGIEGGELIQIADEQVQAWGIGVGKQRASIRRGDYEDDLPSVLVRLWRQKWPGHRHSLELLPAPERYANTCYIHVESPPCVWGWRGRRVGAEPMRPGLRFTQAQHDAIAALAVDVAERNGWPKDSPWWRSARLLGHEDLTPISRHDRRGGWDPGGLREKPYFDWDYVYDEIERRVSGGSLFDVVTRPLGALSGGVASVMRAAQQLILQGKEQLAVAKAHREGMTDENKLTNLVFFTRHPELGGRKIRRHEKDLAEEWLTIRRRVVRPVLERSGQEQLLEAYVGGDDYEPDEYDE